MVSESAFRRPLEEIERRWLACAREAAWAGRDAARPLVGTRAGRRPLGLGGGGDVTIELDRAAEDAVLAVMAREAPAPHSLVTEERGVVRLENGDWVVIVDPVDGSLNAKRGLAPFSVVVAVADGPAISDVRVSYTLDCTTGRAFAAVRGAGIAATPPGQQTWVTPPPPALPDDGHIEVVLLEAGRPGMHAFGYANLAVLATPGHDRDVRVRQIGSLALCLCHVALGVADVLVAPAPSRAVDIAAGLLLLAEAGGGAAGLSGADLWSQPLDLERRTPFLAWRAGLRGDELLTRVGGVFDTA